jgi:hypothetical protein
MSERPKYKIFLSCGAPFTKEQDVFISVVEEYLRNHDCETKTIGRNNFSIRQPAQFARDVIAECDGIVVIAFERLRVEKGKDKPNSKDEKLVVSRSFPTVWNHLEAAMGYAHDLPILTLVAAGLYREGMLSDRFEWFALEVELTPNFLTTEMFHQSFKDWLSRVEERTKTPFKTKIDPSKLRMVDLFMSLTPNQFWGLLGAAFAVIMAVAVLAFKLGAYLEKP